MFLRKNLAGRLTELDDLTLSSFPENGVFYQLKVNGVLVGEIVEHVARLDRSVALLLVSEYKIYT